MLSLWQGSWIAALRGRRAGLGPDPVGGDLPPEEVRPGARADPVQPADRDALHGRPADRHRRPVLLHRPRRDRLTQLSDDPDHTVNVVGFRWSWAFNYVDEDVYDVGTPDEFPTLYLPVNETIRFQLTSPDVIHSFWVPAFLFKMDVIPGRLNEFEMTPEQGGPLRRPVRRAVRRRPLADAVQGRGRRARTSTTSTSPSSKTAARPACSRPTAALRGRRTDGQGVYPDRGQPHDAARGTGHAGHDRSRPRRRSGRSRWASSSSAGSPPPTTRSIGYLYLITSFIVLPGRRRDGADHARRAGPAGHADRVATSSTTSCSRCTARSCCCCSRRRCSSASPT